MNNQISAALLIAIGSLGISSASFAQDGLYVSGGLNNTTIEQGLTRNTGSNGPTTGPADGPSLSSSDRDTSASVFLGLGYRWDLENDYFTAIEVFYADETAETTNINNVLISNVELDSSYGIDFRAGLDVTDRFGVYGLIGATNYRFDSNLAYTFAPPTDFVEQDEWALVYGAGAEIALTNRITGFGEYRISTDVDFDTPRDKGGIVSENELDFAGLRTGIRYRF